MYYDIGQQLSSIFGGGSSPGTGFNATYAAGPANAFPVAPSVWNAPPTLHTPYSSIYVASQHLQLPYSFQ